MLYIFCVLVSVSSIIVAKADSDCDLKFHPDRSTMYPINRHNISLECDATCFDELSIQLQWFGPRRELIPTLPGRIFSVTYDRGMRTRLILLNAQAHDTGRYTCTGVTPDSRVTKAVNVNVIGEDIPVVLPDEGYDNGPSRGDIRVDEPNFPERRPQRSVESILRRIIRGAPEDFNKTSGKEDVDRNITTMSVKPDSTIVGSGDAETMTTVTSETLVNETNAMSEAVSISYSKVSTPKPDINSSSQDTTTVVPVTTSIATSQTTTTNAKREKKTMTTTTNPEPVPKPEDGTTTGPPVAVTVTVLTHFGRYGVLAFALSLSVAFLLLYALLLVIFLPRCCKNRQTVSFDDDTSKKTSKANFDLIGMKKLEDGDHAGAENPAFTTIDLDDHPPGENNTDNNGRGPGGEPSEQPQAESNKFVSSFLIGRNRISSEGKKSPTGEVPPGNGEIFFHIGIPVGGSTTTGSPVDGNTTANSQVHGATANVPETEQTVDESAGTAAENPETEGSVDGEKEKAATSSESKSDSGDEKSPDQSSANEGIGGTTDGIDKDQSATHEKSETNDSGITL